MTRIFQKDQDLRLLILSDAVSPHTARWANSFAEKGSRVVVLSLTPIGDQKYSERVRVHSMNLTREPNLLDRAAFILLANTLALIHRVDLVHSHYCISYGFLGSYVQFGKSVCSVWGSDLLIRAKRSELARERARRALQKADVVCGTSKVLVDVAAVYTDKPLFKTPFGIEQEFVDATVSLAPFRPKTKPTEFVIGCVKWMKLIYGQDVLAEAMSLIRDRRPDIDIHLILTGSGPDEGTIHNLFREAGLGDRVTYTGHLTPVEAMRVHRSIDVAVYPSRSESFGVSLLEASMCELPVVGSDVGGIPEVIADGLTGYLFPVADANKLAELLILLHDEPDTRKRLGSTGRRFVIENYSWTQSLKIMNEVYRQALSS